MTINLFFSRYLPGIFTSIKVYSKNGITIVTCARYTLQCFVRTQVCHGISWLNMTKYTKYVELSCVLHVFCDNEISYFLPLVFVILNGNIFDVTAHGKFFYCRQIYFSNLRISFYLDVVYTICNSLTSIIFIKVEYIPFTLTSVSINEQLVYVSEQLLTMSTLRGNINISLR